MPVHSRIRCPRVGMRRFDVSYLAPRRQFRWRNVLPSFPFILRQFNQPIVRPRPDFPRLHKRRSNRVNHAVAFALWHIRSRRCIQIRWHSGIFSREIGANHLPRASAIRRSKQNLRPEVQHVRIDWRKNQRQRPRASVLARMRQRRRHFLRLFVTEILPCDRAAEHHARTQRVRRDVTIFAARVYWPPIMEIQRAVTAAAWCGYRIAVLLRSVHPVRKLIIRHHVIELRGWLVEPGAPRLTAVARYDRSLVAAENHPPRLIGINPQFVIVVAPGRAFESCERLPSVARLVSCGIRDVHNVWILGIHADFSEIPPALPDAPVIRNALPTLPTVVRTIEPALLGIHDQINPPRIARRKCDADPSESLRWQSLPAHMFPMIASITRAIEPAARSVRRSVDAPRRPPRLPQRGVNYFWIAGLESKIDPARVFVVK